MNRIILFFVFGFLSLSIAEDININIQTEIDLCKKTESMVNFEEECNQFMDLEKRMMCASFINTLNILRDGYNHEYKPVLTLQEKKVFFFDNSHVYNTICSKILGFEIIANFDKCTRDVLVNYKINGTTFQAYLTKFGFLVEESLNLECEDKQEYFPLDDKYSLIKMPNKVILASESSKVNESVYDINDIFKVNTSNKLQNFFWNYQTDFKSNIFYQIFQDLLLILLFVFVLVVTIFFLFKYKKILIQLIKNIVNLYPDLNQKMNCIINYVNKINNIVNRNSEQKFMAVNLDLNESVKTKKYSSINSKTKCQICYKMFSTRGLPMHLKSCKKKNGF